jgi:ArsR family transcriptional regulator, lead/cadmium/zinc/bismuth-responsive transcriptional repressor
MTTLPLVKLPRIVCDPAQPPLTERSLIDEGQARELVALFKVLANDSRLRLLHALERAGELCVSDLAAEVGMTPQAVSNQLQRLVDRRILTARRRGNNVFYRIVDPCVTSLLELALCLNAASTQQRAAGT